MWLSGKDREAAGDGVSGNGGAVMCFRHGVFDRESVYRFTLSRTKGDRQVSAGWS